MVISPVAQVLKERGISVSTVTDKYLSDILWGNVLRIRFPRQFENLDNLAKSELKRLKSRPNEPQIKLSEILLQPNPEPPKRKTNELAEKIEALDRKARLYQHCLAIFRGGNRSRGRTGKLDAVLAITTPLRQPLIEAKQDAVIGPIELDGRIYILKKDGFRENGLSDPKAASLTMARAILPVLAADASREARN